MIHGGDLVGAAKESGKSQEELLDFSANINPLGMQPCVKEAIVSQLHNVLNYPDPLCRKLTGAIADRHQVPEEQILCGSGGADLIYRLAYALRPEKALIMAPTFAEYEEALVQTGTEIAVYEMGQDLTVKENVLEAVMPDLDVLFLCNPNNPTGLLTSRDLILQMIQKAEKNQTVVMIDECFLDFVKEEADFSVIDFLPDYKNLIILKSFTKMYAIPGLRLGYVMSSNTELLEKMRKAGQPWSVGGLAEAAGIAALSEEKFPSESMKVIEKERDFLKNELEKLGLQVYDGRANYLCFYAENEPELYGKLLQHGIMIRRCRNYRGLTSHHYRIAVKAHNENIRLIQSLQQVL